MAGSRRLTVEILGDAKGLGKAFGEAEGSAKKLDGGLNDLDANTEKRMANVGKAAIAAGVAIGAFAVKSVSEFQDLGLEVGKFSDATGLSTETASRWIEVAGDAGIEAGTLESIINKMNVTAGKSPQTFTDLGVEIAKTSDGATDASGTLLNVIDHLNGIKDPAKRAEEGTRLLGRGWKETAELVGRGSTQIRKDLDAVAGSKVFTDDDVSSARGLRNAFDSIRDSVDELMLSLGKNLAPAVIEVADVLVDMVDATQPLVDVIGDTLVDALKKAKPVLKDIANLLGGLSEAAATVIDAVGGIGAVVPIANEGFLEGTVPIYGWTKALFAADDITVQLTGSLIVQADTAALATIRTEDYNATLVEAYERQWKAGEAAREQADKLRDSQAAAQRARDEQNRLADAAARVEEKVRAQTAAWDALIRPLSEEEAFIDLANQFDQLGEKWMTTTAALNEGAISQEQAMRDVASEINATKREVIGYAREIGLTPTQIETKYLALIDQGKYDEVEQRLAILGRNRTMQMSIEVKGGSGAFGNISLTGVRVFDQGGVANWTRGEHRLAMIAGGETVLPTHHRSGGYGSTVVVQVAGSVVTERDLVRSIADGILDAQRRGEFPGDFN